MIKKIVKDALIECAIDQKTIGYEELIRLSNNGRFERALYPSLFKILMEIGDEEHALGHPPINCLAVNMRDSIPGPGFFSWYNKAFKGEGHTSAYLDKKSLLAALGKECSCYWRDVVFEYTLQ